MNIIEASIRLGKAIRKTDIGRQLLNTYQLVSEKYRNEENGDYSLFNQSVEKEACQYNFFAWIISYDKFSYINENPDSENANLFLNTAKLVLADEDVKKLADEAMKMGEIVTKLLDFVLTNNREFNGFGNSFKVKNAITDLMMSIQRTSLILYIASKLRTVIENQKFVEYETERRNKKFLPFSNEAMKFIAENIETDELIKDGIERIVFLQYVISKGIFEGFWDIVSEIQENEITKSNLEFNGKITDVEFCHNNIFIELIHRESWLYKLIYSDRNVYVLANKKSICFVNKDDKDKEVATISGIAYPEEDVKFFESEVIREIL